MFMFDWWFSRWEVHGILGGDLSAHFMPQQGVQLHPDVILVFIFPCPNMKEHDTSPEDINWVIVSPPGKAYYGGGQMERLPFRWYPNPH